MKFAIQTKGDDFSNQLRDTIYNYLMDFNLEFDEEEPDIVISVGGDGTLLYAFHRYVHRLKETAFVGVHTGHLGFYADWTPEEVEKLVIQIARSPLKVVDYPLLEVAISFNNGEEKKRYLALNESTVKSTQSLLITDVLIKNEKFESFRGDGLCISTPTGSTAYNKALSGAIIHPSLASIQLTEIASINNRVYRTVGSPLILPQHHPCQLRPVNETSFHITIDHLSFLHENVRLIECRVAKERVRFARFRPFPFWRRVRDSFIG